MFHLRSLRKFAAAAPRMQPRVYTQNYSDNDQYKGFTGPNPEPEEPFSGSFLSDFYKLPTLQKTDQIDIIGELT